MSILCKNVVAVSKDGLVQVTGKDFVNFQVIGCTADTSTLPGEYTNSFSIFNTHKEGDLLAIVLFVPEHEPTTFLIEIRASKHGLPFIRLQDAESKNAWTPSPERIVQLINDGRIRVQVDEEWWSNSLEDVKNGCLIFPVSYGGVMLKYAFGMIEPRDIIEYAAPKNSAVMLPEEEPILTVLLVEATETTKYVAAAIENASKVCRSGALRRGTAIFTIFDYCDKLPSEPHAPKRTISNIFKLKRVNFVTICHR